VAIILGTVGDDTLTSTADGDILRGFDGDDIYIVNDATDFVLEQINEGYDIVRSDVTFTIASMDNVEELVLTGTTAINGTGNSGDNLLLGNDAANTLDGGAGNDLMVGGFGNDVYIIDSAGDTILELAGQGTDTVRSSIDIDLTTLTLADIENLVLTGAAIEGTGNTNDNQIFGTASTNTLDGGDGDDTLDGSDGTDTGEVDTLIGGLGDDTFIVDNAGDVVIESNDTQDGIDLVDSTVTYSIAGTPDVENLTLSGSGTIDGTGNGVDNYITGNDQINVLDGAAGNDTLDGGLGADTMIGGLGDDSFYVDDVSDVVSENGGEGTDTIISTASFNLATSATNVENLTLSGAAVSGTGDGGVNVITGTAGNNTLDGGGGDDTLVGLDGNDVYVVDSSGDTVLENSDEGTDTIQSTVDFDLSVGGQNVENLTLLGAAIDGTGDTGDNVITGNANVNTLSGGAGNDTLDGDGDSDTLVFGADSMIGGLGNDVFIVDDAGDSITEAGSGGTDTVQTEVTYTLTTGAEVETITITGLGAIDVTGNATGQFIGGNASTNTLDGGGGDDTLDGGGAGEADRMIGGTGDDTFFIDSSSDVLVENLAEGTDEAFSSVDFNLNTNGANVDNLTLTGTALVGTGNAIDNLITGNASNNTLSGGGGDDVLDGGAGNDSMIGGTGDDTFIVDAAGDSVTESTGQGTDTVISSLNYTLSSTQEVENLTLIGAAVTGTGNALDNTITGNGEDNILTGAAGNDSLSGSLGIDTLNGGAGNDTLDGGLDADRMIGGAGNDVFTVDDAGDVVTETTSGSLGGTDTVLSSISFTLGTNFENLTLDPAAGNIDGTGNSVANIIIGNAGDNTLNGMGGADTMTGGGGNDTFFVDTLLDTVVGGAGTDTIVSTLSYTLNTVALANVENLTLTGSAVTATGNALDNLITGNGATNTLIGLDGNDTLDGGLGNDSLIGGLGDDTLVVNAQTDILIELAGQGTDTVLSSVTYILSAANVENVTLSGSANINATGSAGNNVITGNSGNNVLNGGLGVDSLEGGLGNDTFVVDTITDIITDAGGNDTISTQIDSNTFDWLNIYTGVIENLTLTGTAVYGLGDLNDNAITGNAAINTLDGGDGDDTLNGGAGGDTMIGGLGDDTFFVDSLLDVVSENGGEGTDTIILVNGLGNYVIPSGVSVENLVIIGTTSGGLIGDANDNILTGNSGANSINGMGGADTMIGGLGNDTYFVDDEDDFIVEDEGEGVEKIIATASATFTTFDMSTNAENVEGFTLLSTTEDFILIGNINDNKLVTSSGDDTIVSGGGRDSLNGGLGDDLYYAGIGDVIADSGGHDTLITNNHYILPTFLEDVFLFDPDDIEAEFYVKGNASANLIDGSNLTVDYTFFGYGGADTMIGGEGADTLDGGTGADTMAGGEGDDVYLVDNTSDVVIENDDEGDDSLTAKVHFTLLSTSEVETITLTGGTNQIFVSSDTDNVITVGNTSAKNIYGMGGDDTLTGSGAADTLFGGDGDDILTGGAGGDRIEGGAGDDTIEGGLYQDILTGGDGQDTFVFLFDTAFLNVDIIKDFDLYDAGSLTDPLLGDILDLSDILDNVTGTGQIEPASNWVRLQDSGQNTLLQIDRDGAGTVYSFKTIAVLENVSSISEVSLLASGNIEDGGFFS
jgi:trimeric autotransporter adhesin